MIGMEALVSLTAKLTDKYTSKDSSSISYETAQMLMKAVIYCIREQEETDENRPALARENEADWERVYRAGYERVLQKVMQAKELYEELIVDFDDYGCINYRDAITKGMPAFFVNYNPRFCPQNHILTLDYPAIFVGKNLCGVDLILEYLQGIQLESKFLRKFPRERVIHVLSEILPEYEELYLDNICSPVLMRAVGGMIAGKSVLGLELEQKDNEAIREQFCGKGKDEITVKLQNALRVITSSLPELEFVGGEEYFMKIVEDYAVRVQYLVNGKSMQRIL